MGFNFTYVCDLLQRLEDNQYARAGVRTSAEILRQWFASHRAQVLRDGHDSAALLSTLLPEKRSDRVYLIREKRLQTLIGRALGLGRSRIAQLGRWNSPGSGVALAECVESVLKETPNPIFPAEIEVTVEEIDGLLHQIASACRFSSPAVRSSGSNPKLADREFALGDLYKRLTARDAKWLTRLILKNFEPVVLDPQIVYRAYHPSLPSILKVQDDFAVAGRILTKLRRDRSVVGRSDLAEYLKPALGVKVGRQPWYKGRSIKHCLDMGHGRMSCETKMDGEYCQIHIDLSKGRDCIQIFSKSGKDSTRDRVGLHDDIKRSLQLGQPSCPLKSGCILEGELVVYSDREEKILDFYKIRKHVSRSGTFIGTDQDSQPHPWEHLMIVYYDLLMADDEPLLSVRRSKRTERLKQLITEIPGRSALVKRQTIDCDRPSARSDLRRAFAKCIVAREEGLVLKPDDPYFDFNTTRRPYSSCAIKLKKEYVGNFGDIGDFAVVGARFDAAKAKTYNLPNIKWTHFYVGCLENKDEVQRFKRKPKFVVTNVVELNATQLEMFTAAVNPTHVPEAEDDSISLRIEPGVDEGRRPSAIFPEPPVFDLRCFSFDKAGNTAFWSPRFPMVNKIHCDRTFHDTLSFSELQEIAIKEKELPPPDDSQELLGWIAALENADPGRLIVDASSQASTASRASPVQTPTSPSVAASSQARLDVSTARPSLVNCPLDVPLAGFVSDKPLILDGQPAWSKLSSVPVLDKYGPKDLSPIDLSPIPPLVTERRKRSLEVHHTQLECAADRTKARRHSVEQTAATGSAVPSPSRPDSSSDDQREPLTDISSSSPRRNSVILSRGALPPRLAGVNSMYQPSADETSVGREKPPTLGRGSVMLTSSTSFSRSLPDPAQAYISGTKMPQTTTSPQGICKHLGDACTLTGYSFLLAPCIANFPWVTEDLLSCHGIRAFACDPVEWSLTSTPSTAMASTTHSNHNRNMKILVDRRRKDATKTFLKRAEDAKLTRRNGEKRWVDVYDWRVLEELKKEEEKWMRRNKDTSRSSWKSDGEGEGNASESSTVRAIWRKFWVGLV